jgi:16S rRNA (uracil1498-N3)-methyltransferase
LETGSRFSTDKEPKPTSATRVQVTLATAVPKVDRMRWLVEKATELGVERLIPLQTSRSVVAPGAVKLDKLRQAVIEACKQSGRNRLMTVDSLTSWKQFVAEVMPAQATLVADRGGLPLPSLELPALPKTPVLLVIGPEGGLSPAEIHEAVEAGARTVSLGTNILRIETAALALAAVFLLK